MTRSRAFLLFILLLSFLSPSAYRSDRMPSLEELRLPAGDIVECYLLPDISAYLNGGSTTDREKLTKIVNYLNRIRYHACSEKWIHSDDSAYGGVRNKYAVVFIYADGTEHQLIFYGDSAVQRYDGVLLHAIDRFELSPGEFLCKTLEIDRIAELERVPVPDENVVRFEYVGPEAPEGVIVTDPQRLHIIIHTLNVQDYYPCIGYKSDFPELQNYYTITYADGSRIRCDTVDRFIRTQDGFWFQHAGSYQVYYDVVMKYQTIPE